VSRNQHIIGHFGDESFQSVTCTGTDNLTRTTKRHNTQTTQSNATQKVTTAASRSCLVTLIFDLLTLKVSHVWRGLPVCQFWSPCLYVLDLDPMYATDRRQTSDS